MLGISWLKQHDPWIHWSRHRITFNSPYCLSLCRIQKPTTVVALAQNPQETLSVVEPEPKPKVVALEFNQQDTLSVVKPKRPLPSTKPKESPLVELDVTVPLALADLPTPLPRTLGEDQRDENDGCLRVLPPRDPPKVIRCKVLRKSLKKETVDQAKPQILQLNSKSWISTSKITYAKASSAIPNPRPQHRFCLSRNPTARYGCASTTEVSTKSRSRIDILCPLLLNSSISVVMLSISLALTSAMVITCCGWRWDRSGKRLFAVVTGCMSTMSCHLDQSWPMTGLKPDGGPECPGIFRSRLALSLTADRSIPIRCLYPPRVVPTRC
jgi:hypothetical protein